MTTRWGCDVSEHNLTELVPPCDFGWARLTNGTRRDRLCVQHVARLRELVALAGGYHVYRNDQAPADQLQAFAAAWQACGLDFGERLVPAIDVEKNYGAPDPNWVIGLSQLVELVETHFGAKPALYWTQSTWAQLGRPAHFADCPQWIAHWTSAAQPASPYGKWDVWQYAVHDWRPGEPHTSSGASHPERIDHDRCDGALPLLAPAFPPVTAPSNADLMAALQTQTTELQETRALVELLHSRLNGLALPKP